ncbi:hypothetical protein KQH89_17240, partial [Vibrio cholerae]|uniref:hypothetical protein n=1 Tax=Vibrio cholerae TaxID=666 RepID=UPI001C0F4937
LTQDRIEAALGEDLLDIGIGFTGEHGLEVDCEALFVEELSLVVSASHSERNQRAWLEQPLVLLNTGFAT